MNLFTRYFRVNLLATIVIFLLASIAFYFLLWYVSIEQLDDNLRIEQREVVSFVAKYHSPPDTINVKDQNITYEKSDIKKSYQNFSTIKSPNQNERGNYRQISFTILINDQWYLFKVSKSLEGTEHLNRSIILISLLTIVAILFVSLLINRWLLRRLWKPFYATLGAVEKFRLGEKRVPALAPTGISEFDLLNKTIQQFIQEAEKEYLHLKEFTENASHELQTPLAIVQSTLDVMIQDEKLTETQSNALQNAYTAIQKMSKLNQSLLLLNKIDNRQFSDVHEFDFKSLVEQKMTDWGELWQGRNLKTNASLFPTPVVMNEQLAEIMLNNFFSNAARHSLEGGSIDINLSQNMFEISNSAAGGSLNPDKIFQRFSKGGQATDQHGLGLSIVKQITDASEKKIAYRFEDGRHIFSIQF